MNKYQEALYNCVFSESVDKGNYDLLKELVDKETPKEPIYKRDNNRYVCGKCEERFPYRRNCIDQYIFPYCPYCGQKVEWSE